jgi:hypothetical protein
MVEVEWNITPAKRAPLLLAEMRRISSPACLSLTKSGSLIEPESSTHCA